MANRTPSSLLKKAGVTGDSQPMPFADLGGGSNNQAEQFRDQLTALPDQQKTDMLIDLMGTYLKRPEMQQMIEEYASQVPAETEQPPAEAAPTAALPPETAGAVPVTA